MSLSASESALGDVGDVAMNDSIFTLANAWRTEANAPEILPYKEELVEEIKEFLKNQEVIDFWYFSCGFYEPNSGPNFTIDEPLLLSSSYRHISTRFLRMLQNTSSLL